MSQSTTPFTCENGLTGGQHLWKAVDQLAALQKGALTIEAPHTPVAKATAIDYTLST